ncbi:hypothetical protein [Staphylococcus saprophyticus]|nr:hypothetical protein [Staphylococcus saprophyticus]
MDNQTAIYKHVVQLTDIMKATTDEQTKKQLDKQISEMAKDFNINL